MELLKYKGFEGSAELDMQKHVCWGKILYIDDVVTYQSQSIDGLQKQFEDAVDDYIETCELIGKEPQKPCRGMFNVRVNPELHKAALRRAVVDETSLNDVVCKALEAYLSSTSSVSVVSLAPSLARVKNRTVKAPHFSSEVFERHHANAFVNAETVLGSLIHPAAQDYPAYAQTSGYLEKSIVEESNEASYAH